MVESDSEYPLGRRIAVFGKGGKTTLSKALARRFHLEFIEQDSIKHQANWVELSPEEHWCAAETRFEQAPNGWVSDGNYSALRDLVLARIDTVVVLALPWRVMLWRTFKRTVIRLVTREELWNGNRENFRGSFLSRDSIIYDLFRRRRRFMSFGEQAEAETPAHIKLVVVRTSRELDDLYREHGLIRE
ncbi:MAG: adenylate kinase [Chloroflexi bacterium]|nr:adenylate kinase [Chloroflexota bacterium]